VVAKAESQSNSGFRGARLLDPLRDFGAVARLLEEAFRPDQNFPFSNLPFLREFGIFLWTLSYAPGFPDLTTGFVWVEEGRIVGNVTLSPYESRLDRYMITNVAVKPSYRRRGVARALMQESINHLRTLKVKTALLNVRPTNPGAVKLYKDLGFVEFETRGEWKRAASHAPFAGVWHPIALRPVRESDYRQAAELVRAVAPVNASRYHPLRNVFTPRKDDRMVEAMGDLLTGQTTERWALELDGQLAALLLIRAQQLMTPHRLSVEVQPSFRGRVENDLLAFALRELEHFPQHEIRVSVESAHPEWITALEQNGFKTHDALTLMALTL
jgi:ribosomal protein S18 acetylase RimI-like enzyme